MVGERFGQWNGKTFNLVCGATLVFDRRGNLLAWSRKPGAAYQRRRGAGIARPPGSLER
jgi:hypothetical protein